MAAAKISPLEELKAARIEALSERLSELDDAAAEALIDLLPPENDLHWDMRDQRSRYQRDNVEKLIRGLCSGMTRTEAIKYAGMTYSTFRKWMNDESRAEFQYWVSQALAYRREVALDKYRLSIEAHSETDWRAAAWLAEKLDPSTYGSIQTVHVDGHLSSVANMTFEQAYLLKYGKAPEYPGLNAASDLRDGDGC